MVSSMLPLGGTGSILCAELLGVDLLLAVVMIAFMLLYPDMAQDADAAAM